MMTLLRAVPTEMDADVANELASILRAVIKENNLADLTKAMSYQGLELHEQSEDLRTFFSTISKTPPHLLPLGASVFCAS